MKENLFQRFDFILPAAAVLLSCAGIILIQSAFGGVSSVAPETIRQLAYLGVGLIVMLIFTFVDYETWGRLAVPLSILNMALLVFVIIAGHSAKGAQRWISLGALGTFQPSEPAKIFLIIALAAILSGTKKLSGKMVFPIFLTVLIPWFLIFVQPDLGTSVVLLFISFVMLFMSGTNPLLILSVISAGAIALPFVLRDYQKERLLVFMNPNEDVSGAAWNITQSKIAMGNGGLLGKGLFGGSQTQLDFVPEHGTDFIFSVAGEEWGFLGVLLILALYAVILWRCLIIIKSAKDDFGFFTAIGIFCLILFHLFVNIGMTSGIMPVVGVPLSFVSFGGSALIVNFMAIGILESIYSRRGRLFLK